MLTSRCFSCTMRGAGRAGLDGAPPVPSLVHVARLVPVLATMLSLEFAESLRLSLPSALSFRQRMTSCWMTASLLCAGMAHAQAAQPAASGPQAPASLAVLPSAAPSVAPGAEAASAPRPSVSEDRVRQALALRLAASSSAKGALLIRLPGIAAQDSARQVPFQAQWVGQPWPIEARVNVASITKVFTSSLLAKLAQQGVVALDTPLSSHWPELAGHPAGKITLQALATHSSGLPRLPATWQVTWRALTHPQDPYQGADEPEVLRALLDFKPPAQTQPQYSNLGMGVLGLTLERATGQRLEALMARHLFAPAGLGTPALMPGDVQGPMARGHAEQGGDMGPWHLGPYRAAGGLWLNGRELAQLLDLARRQAAPFDAGATQPRLPLKDQAGLKEWQGLGWVLREQGGERMVWHNGAASGFSSMMAYRERDGEAVIILADGDLAMEDIAFHALAPSVPLKAPDEGRRDEGGFLRWTAVVTALAAFYALAHALLRPRTFPSFHAAALGTMLPNGLLAMTGLWHGRQWLASWLPASAALTGALALATCVAVSCAALWRARGLPRHATDDKGRQQERQLLRQLWIALPVSVFFLLTAP